MRKTCTVVVVVLVLVQLLAIPVSAAGSDLLFVDAIGGFFSDLIDSIVNLGTFIFESIMKGINVLLTGLQKLFIPDPSFFPDLADRLYNAFEKKFGGLLSLAEHLKSAFSNLKAYRGDLLVIKFPQGHLLGGSEVDLLSGSNGIANLIRSALSGFVVLCTATFAYKKVTSMINT